MLSRRPFRAQDRPFKAVPITEAENRVQLDTIQILLELSGERGVDVL